MLSNYIFLILNSKDLSDETFLETALPLKENIPVKDFCNLTESLIL